MVSSGLSLDVVDKVLDVTHKVQPHTMSVFSLVQEALTQALEELRYGVWSGCGLIQEALSYAL